MPTGDADKIIKALSPQLQDIAKRLDELDINGDIKKKRRWLLLNGSQLLSEPFPAWPLQWQNSKE